MCAYQDVCDALGIQNSRDVMKHMDEWYVCTMDVSTPIISQGKDTGMSKKINIFINRYGCCETFMRKIIF